jgi:cell division protein FtsI (penicillin-binding protein 3)
MLDQSNISKRAYVAFLVLVLAGLAIIGKVFWLQAFPSQRALEIAQNYTYKVNEIEPSRGQIFSSDGSLLATSVPEYEIRWDSKAQYDAEVYRQKIDSLALGLSQLFGDRSKAEYAKLFSDARKTGERYAKIADHVDYNQLQKLKKLPFVKMGKFKSGFVFIEKNKRIKPFGSLAARTIGLEREDNKVGIELAYDELLRGVKGTQLQEKIAGGVWKPMTDEFIVEPQPGADIVATIDVHLQDVAHAALKRTLEANNASWGCVVLMEVETGFVRAIANLSKNESNGTYDEILNLAISQNIEPGSTAKLASLLACLDEGMVQPEDLIETGNGSMHIDGRNLTDSNHDKGGNGTITVEQVFEKSSNIGTALVVKKSFGGRAQKFLDKLNSFGLGDSLGLNLAGETTPRLYKTVDTKKGWSLLSLTQIGIGYEWQCTPLQTLAFYNSIANNGKMVRPQFVQEIRKNGRTVERMEPVVLREGFVKPETIQKARKMMEGVMEKGGTAERVFATSPYHVGGKTGTAWLNEGGYQDNRYRGSFVGYFPAEKPKYSCIVVVHDPRNGAYYGSAVAAPVFKELADKIYSTELEFHAPTQIPDSLMIAQRQLPVSKSGSRKELNTVLTGLNIATNGSVSADWISTNTEKEQVRVEDRAFTPGTVPNVVGMGLQDALYLLENSGLKVQVLGYGTVKRQSVQPGAVVKSNPYITIELL